MTRLLLTNMLYSFIAAALGVMVPLYLIEKNVDITYIGIILSLGPISFMFIRTYLATIADEIGTRAIGIFYSAANMLAVALYIFFPSTAGFTMGTLGEGMRNSGFWAIARTETISENRGYPGRILAYFSAMRQLADGAGRLVIGFLLAYLAFQGSFIIFFGLSIALLLLVLSNDNSRPDVSRHGRSVVERVFKKRPASFWYASLLALLSWLPYNMLLGFLLPVYFVSSLRMGYLETGGFIALLSLAIAGSAILTTRWNFKKSTMVLMSLLVVPALAFIPFAGNAVALPLLLTAIGMGCMSIVAEYILVDVIYRSKDVSTDIGVFYSPLKVAEFSFLSLSGIVISRFGYVPLFLICSVSMLLFALLAKRVLAKG